MLTLSWMLGHGAVAPEAAWSTWLREPSVVAALVPFVVLYGAGVRAARGRPALADLTHRRLLAAAGAVVVLVVALVSPLDAVATSLFSAHMVQHLLLSAVAAPLLVLAAPVSTIRRGLPSWSVARLDRLRPGSSTRRWLPLLGTGVAVGTMSVWHVPALYDAALRSGPVHAIEHATILTAGLLLWAAVIGAARRRQVLAAVSALAVVSVHGGALGALLALSPRPWYSLHAAGARSWDVEALADQQVAGAIMWVPTAAVYLGAVAVLLHRWFDDADQRSSRYLSNRSSRTSRRRLASVRPVVPARRDSRSRSARG